MVEGDLIEGRFRVGARIGQGGFGVVHRAWDERLERHVAIKEIVGGDYRRVEREAQAAARLSHPGIVTLYELARGSSSTYLVSELVDGATLRALLTDGALADRDVAVVGGELCLALEHAHGRGVVHRDIKPENVIVAVGDPQSGAGRGQVKLMDFGIAAILGAPTLTETGQMVGTIAYIAPEVAEGRRAGPPADVYALGLNLYESWCGRNPVARSTPAATARSIGSEIPALTVGRPDMPPAMAEVVDACLEPEPEARPRLDELRSSLRSAEPELHPSSPVPIPPQAPGIPEDGAAPTLRAHPFTLAALIGLVAVVAGLALIGQRGTALVAAVLVAPLLLLVRSPSAWGAPILAPVMASLGLGPVYVVIAALLGRTLMERIVVGVIGVAWMAAAAVLIGTNTALVDLPRETGWAESGSEAAAALAAAATTQVAALAALAGAGAATLGIVLALRPVGLRPVVAIAWAAGMIAGYELVFGPAFGASPETDGAASILLAVAVLAAVAVTTFTRSPRPGGRRRRGMPADAEGEAPRQGGPTAAARRARTATLGTRGP